ncbi:unnamed protein product, partial [Polarella glacialis]
MFTNLGPAGWADFSHLQTWDSSAGTFDIAMTSLVVQSGLARAYAALMQFPMIVMALLPGGCTLRLCRALNYCNRFEWPSGGMRDGERAKVTASMAGSSYESDFEGKMGFTQWFIQRDGGRMYERDTTWLGDYMQFHDYKLLRLVDESGTIDEEHFRMFMKKKGDQVSLSVSSGGDGTADAIVQCVSRAARLSIGSTLHCHVKTVTQTHRRASTSRQSSSSALEKDWLNVPNALTLARLAAIPGIMLSWYSGTPGVAAVLFGAAAATDFLDGYLARRWGQSTPLGALLDPLADKLLVSSALLLLVEHSSCAAVT